MTDRTLTEIERQAAREAWSLLKPSERRILRVASVGEACPVGMSKPRIYLERHGFIETKQDDEGRYWMTLTPIGRAAMGRKA